MARHNVATHNNIATSTEKAAAKGAQEVGRAPDGPAALDVDRFTGIIGDLSAINGNSLAGSAASPRD
ncbi:MAG: hypothetical protein HKO07_09350 [Pseudomonadales bacterium]|nr:hypothetical protein [Pseudomonadales bacterium]